MEAASQGAHQAGGLVIGIAPGATPAGLSSAVDIPILTGMGAARNVVNVLSSRVVIACGLGAGTLSEIALALKLGKPLVLMHVPASLVVTVTPLATAPLAVAETVEGAIAQVNQRLGQET